MELVNEFEGYELEWLLKVIIHTDIDFNDHPDEAIDLVKNTLSLPFFRTFNSHVYNSKRPGKFGERFIKRIHKDLKNREFVSVILSDNDQINNTDNRFMLSLNPYFSETSELYEYAAKGTIELFIPIENAIAHQDLIIQWFKETAEKWQGIYGYATFYVYGLFMDDYFKNEIQRNPIDCINANFYNHFVKNKIKDIYWLNLISKHHLNNISLDELSLESETLETDAIVFKCLPSLEPEVWSESDILQMRKLVNEHIVRHKVPDYEWTL